MCLTLLNTAIHTRTDTMPTCTLNTAHVCTFARADHYHEEARPEHRKERERPELRHGQNFTGVTDWPRFLGHMSLKLKQPWRAAVQCHQVYTLTTELTQN